MRRKPMRNNIVFSVVEEKTQCHIHDKVGNVEAVEIREKVCVHENVYPLKTYTDNKHYCLFHFPSQDKDITKFEEVLDLRLKSVWEEAYKIYTLPIEQREEAKGEFTHDFRYVWFPSWVNLSELRFETDVNFSSATFSSQTDFWSTSFLGKSNFSSTIFIQDCKFNSAIFMSSDFASATFMGDADFQHSTFKEIANFKKSTFTGVAYFRHAEFSSDANFEEATFIAEAKFWKAVFDEKGRAHFYKSKFAKDTFFDDVKFNSNVSFNSAIFGSESDALFRRTQFAKKADFAYSTADGYLRFSNLKQGDDFLFDFQETTFEKASRISFSSMSLRPSWFINTDSRKFVFTDINWIDSSNIIARSNVEAELLLLKNRGIVNPKQLLKITLRQLAENAESNNRFEEASHFRNMAFETEWLHKKEKQKAGRSKIRDLITTGISCPLKLNSFIKEFRNVIKRVLGELISSQSIILHRLYRFSSSFGESTARAFWVLVGIILISSILYMSPICKFGRNEGQHSLDLEEAIPYSLRVMLLQRPEPQPENNAAKWAVTAESVFAPLQAALLALAIRRKFMR